MPQTDVFGTILQVARLSRQSLHGLRQTPCFQVLELTTSLPRPNLCNVKRWRGLGIGPAAAAAPGGGIRGCGIRFPCREDTCSCDVIPLKIELTQVWKDVPVVARALPRRRFSNLWSCFSDHEKFFQER